MHGHPQRRRERGDALAADGDRPVSVVAHGSWDAVAEFNAAFHAYYAPLCAFASRMLQAREVAEDVVQEVFLAVWRHPQGMTPAHLTRGYLYGAVRNTVLWRLRDARVAERFVGDVDSALYEPDRDHTVADDAERRDLVHAARRAIARLPERCALVFALSREHGLTYPEIAEALGISVKTVETQIGRAIRSLRLALAAYLSMIVLVGSR